MFLSIKLLVGSAVVSWGAFGVFGACGAWSVARAGIATPDVVAARAPAPAPAEPASAAPWDAARDDVSACAFLRHSYREVARRGAWTSVEADYGTLHTPRGEGCAVELADDAGASITIAVPAWGAYVVSDELYLVELTGAPTYVFAAGDACALVPRDDTCYDTDNLRSYSHVGHCWSPTAWDLASRCWIKKCDGKGDCKLKVRFVPDAGGGEEEISGRCDSPQTDRSVLCGERLCFEHS